MTNKAGVKTTAELERIASEIRYKVIELSHRAKTPHIASSLSCIDLLVAAYFTALNIDPQKPLDPLRDRFILSKGHAALAIFVTLWRRGFCSLEHLESYSRPGSHLCEHPTPGSVPGVEVATGSLGHGLSFGLGMALAARVQKQHFRVLVTLSDGECNEGSVWEAAMFGSGLGLSNVTVMVDYNKWQATGRSNEVLGLAPLADKWRAFGWETKEIDGHDMGAIVSLLQELPKENNKPLAVIAHTIKGKGVSFMQDDNNWHYRIPTDEELLACRKELLS